MLNFDLELSTYMIEWQGLESVVTQVQFPYAAIFFSFCLDIGNNITWRNKLLKSIAISKLVH